MQSSRPRPAQVVAVADFFLVLLLVLVCGATAGIATAQTPPPWRYDLRPGDHLVYRYTFQRRRQSDEEQTQTEARFRTHVLVSGEISGRISLGFQRNREAAELTEYRSKGKDRLAHELPGFQKRMEKRPSRFSEAMEISPTGEPLYSWEMARETYSHILDVLHEVLPLPPIPVAKGEVWRSRTLGLDFRWVDDESIHGRLCHHVEGTAPTLKLSYWWSPESGVLEQVAVDANYSYFGTAHETARMELEFRARGEQLASWLGSADTRQGALQAILLTSEVPVSAAQLAPVLTSGEPASQALALAVASRRNIDVPPGVLNQLGKSASARVRLMVEASSDARSSRELAHEKTEECRRAIPRAPAAAKRGTVLEVAAATKDSPQIPYMLRVPLSYREDRPAPLLVYLSGGAGFAIDGVNSAEDVVSDTDYVVLYPQAAAYWWTPEVARRFDTVLRDVLKRYNIDRDRIYLTGFSNGGTGALYFATLWPQRFAAVVSLMGAGECNDQVKAGLPNLGNLPLLFVHGENDPRIEPECSRSTHAALTEMRHAFKPELKILPNRGHDLALDSDDGLTLAFFADKLRSPFPREVNLSLSDSLAARGYWVEILDGQPGKSTLEARIKADNSGNIVDIHTKNVTKIRLYLRPELFAKPGDARIVWNGKTFREPIRDVCSLPTPSSGDLSLDLADTRELNLP